MRVRLQEMFLLVLGGVVLGTPAAGAFRNLRAGMDCPQIKTSGFNSYEVAKGKTLIVVFWAGWSERSLEELDDLHRFYEVYKSSGLEIVAVNVEKDRLSVSETDSIRQLYSSRGYTFPLVVDEGLSVFHNF